MKIVFIGGRSLHLLGGIENYMLNLTRELTKLGHECIVWCESDHNGIEWIDGVKVIYQTGPKSNLICKPWCGLKATLKTVFGIRDVDLIHYNAWPPSIWSWIPRLFGIPSLMEGHGLEWQRSKYSPFARKILKLMERITAHTNQHLIMCSKNQVDYFRQEYGVESVCIPGAASFPEENAGIGSDILDRYSLTEKKYFLFMGRLVQDKNPDILIKAFRNAGIDGWKLVIAGGNDVMPQYIAQLHKMAEGNTDIVFTGAVYGEDKAWLLKNAYCFCLPSSIEGLSIALMEAASYKLPVIASNIEANIEFLGDAAQYVRPEDTHELSEAMRYAVQNPDTIIQYGNMNYNKIRESYSWDKVAVKYIETITDIAG